jgi:hypothetical protein
VMKSIWTGEPNEKQREQRDFAEAERTATHRSASSTCLLTCFASET